MRIRADYHTHTRYSHGKGTVRDNVLSAISRGLSEVAISDHGPAMIGIGVKRDAWPRLVEDIRRCRDEFPGIKVLAAIEANVTSIDGDVDIPPEIDCALDMRLVGIHLQIVGRSLNDTMRLVVNNLTAARWTRAMSRVARIDNTKALVEAVYRHRIDIVTHPGLHVNIDTAELARACASRGTAMEINSYHACGGVEYVKTAAKQGVRFALSSDAHHPRDVGRVDAAIRIAEKAGLGPDQIINVEMQDEADPE